VGALAATCKTWHDFCEDNEVWKALYMRTIRATIEDTSIHIGGPYERYRDIRGERRKNECPLYYKVCPVQTKYRPNPGITVNDFPSTRSVTWWHPNTRELLRNHACLSHPANAEFVSTLKTWREVRDDGIDNDEFIQLEATLRWSVWACRDVLPYLSYVEDAWIKYNREHGLSTVNLCQCPEHYLFETLGLPAVCRNYKCFKKMTLKKEKTKAEKQFKKTEKIYGKKRREYDAAVRVMQRAEKEMMKAREDNAKTCRLCDNLDNVPGVKKVKKPVIGIAYPKPSGVGWWDARVSQTIPQISTQTSSD